MDEIAGRVADAAEVDPDEFRARAAAEADRLKGQLEIGTFDNTRANVGFEYEFYAVDDPTGVLRRVPEPLLSLIGFERELGRHNAELTASPQPLGPHGLAAVRREVQAAVRSAHDAAADSEGMRLVSDGLWTVPPVSETAAEYFTDTETRDGLVLSSNLTPSVRYHLLTNSSAYDGRMRVDAPNASLDARTVAPSSMTTTIQPHYQMSVAADLPTYFRYALRIAGPLVALAANSPLFPPSLYDEGATAEDVLAEGHCEGRIRVFESVMNDPDGTPKVDFPRDLDSTAHAVDRLVADPLLAPVALDRDDRLDDQFAHIRHKHGTYWRWVRPVFEGADEASANARIEFRPLPAQPTVRDSVAFLAAFAGLMEGLVRADHPVADLSWERARENFYEAARNGLDAETTWIAADGTRTTDTDRLYDDLFRHARSGLTACGFGAPDARAVLRPLRERVRRRTTPAGWKRDRLREHAETGTPLEGAVLAVKRAYMNRQSETLVTGLFTDWPGV
jgi:gamma-glutamyl:cysteine ligase YbdK (ATP-grasp superfamily)